MLSVPLLLIPNYVIIIINKGENEMSHNPKKAIRQHLSSINTSLVNIENRIVALAEIYGEKRYTIEQMLDSVFDETSTENFNGRIDYVRYIVMMYFYYQQIKDVWDDLNIRS